MNLLDFNTDHYHHHLILDNKRFKPLKNQKFEKLRLYRVWRQIGRFLVRAHFSYSSPTPSLEPLVTKKPKDLLTHLFVIDHHHHHYHRCRARLFRGLVLTWCLTLKKTGHAHRKLTST